MTCIVKNNHLKVLFKEIQFVAFFIFHMEKTRMQVKNDLRCLRQITQCPFISLLKPVIECHYSCYHQSSYAICLTWERRSFLLHYFSNGYAHHNVHIFFKIIKITRRNCRQAKTVVPQAYPGYGIPGMPGYVLAFSHLRSRQPSSLLHLRKGRMVQ